MIIQRDLYIDGLHYLVKFQHYTFSFSLVHLPRQRIHTHKRKKSDLLFFYDDPIYEDLNINAPAFKVFNKVMQQIEDIVRYYKIQYWEFSATSIKKARIYAKLMDRYIQQRKVACAYLQDGLNFYVYPQL